MLQQIHTLAVMDDIVGVAIEQFRIEVSDVICTRCRLVGTEFLKHTIGGSSIEIIVALISSIRARKRIRLAFADEVESIEFAGIGEHGAGIIVALVQTRTVGQQLHFINMGIKIVNYVIP